MILFKDKVAQNILNAIEYHVIKDIITDAVSKLKDSGSKQRDIIDFIKQLETTVLNFDTKNLTNDQLDNLIDAQNILTLMLNKDLKKAI